MNNILIKDIEHFDKPGHWLGYKIIMSDDTKNITCKISNDNLCCENWGVYTKDKLNDFIGSEYNSISIGEIEKSTDYMVKIKIIIHTNKGKITIIFYNEHNGYYPHDVYIESENGIKYISL
jgi:hypothetical protein